MRTTFMLAFLLLAGLSHGDDERTSTIDELRLEKVVLLQQAYDLTVAAYKQGEVKITAVHRSQMALLDGTLEVTKTHKDRMEVHQKLVNAASDLLRAYESLVADKEVGRVELIKAKVMLVERKIGFAKEDAAGK